MDPHIKLPDHIYTQFSPNEQHAGKQIGANNQNFDTELQAYYSESSSPWHWNETTGLSSVNRKVVLIKMELNLGGRCY